MKFTLIYFLEEYKVSMQSIAERLDTYSKKEQAKVTFDCLFPDCTTDESTAGNLVAFYGFTVRLSNKKWWCAKLFKECKKLYRRCAVPDVELLMQNNANFCAGFCRLAYAERQFNENWWQYVAWHCHNIVELSTLKFRLRSGLLNVINQPDWAFIMQSKDVVPGLESAEVLGQFAGVPIPFIEDDTEALCFICIENIKPSLHELLGGVCEFCLRKSIEPEPGFALTSAMFKHPVKRTPLTDEILSALSMRAATGRTGLRDIAPDVVPQFNYLLMVEQLKELLGDDWYQMLDSQQVKVGACIDCDRICNGPLDDCGANRMPFMVVCPPCEELRIANANASSDRLQCPSCNLPLEHAGGCFHMACCQAHGVHCTGSDCDHGLVGCGTHFCRFCKEQFQGHNAYEHRCPDRNQDEEYLTD